MKAAWNDIKITPYPVTRFTQYDSYNDAVDLKAGVLAQGTKNVLIVGGNVIKISGLNEYLSAANHVLPISGLHLFRDASKQSRILYYVGNKLYAVNPSSDVISSNTWVITDSVLGAWLDIVQLNNMAVIASGEAVALKKYTIAAGVEVLAGTNVPCCSALYVHKSRIFGVLGSYLYFCDINDPAGTWNNIPIDLENKYDLVALGEVGNQLYVFKENKAYAVDTYADDYTGWKVNPVPESIEGILPGGVFTIPDFYTVVATKTGIYAFDGVSFTMMSESILKDLALIDYIERRAFFYYDDVNKLLGFNYIPANAIINNSFSDATGTTPYLFPGWKDSIVGTATVLQKEDSERKYVELKTVAEDDVATISTLPIVTFPVVGNVEIAETTTADFSGGTLDGVTASSNALVLDVTEGGIDSFDDETVWVSSDASCVVSQETTDTKSGDKAVKVTVTVPGSALDAQYDTASLEVITIALNDESAIEAETFTILSSGQLDSISLPLRKSAGATGYLYVEILDTTAGQPNSSLASTYIDMAELSTTTTWEDIAISSFSVTASDVLAVVVYPGSGCTGSAYWEYKITSAYSGGSRWSSANGGASWTQDSDNDFHFKAYVTPLISHPYIEIDFGSGTEKDLSAVNTLLTQLKSTSAAPIIVGFGEAAATEQEDTVNLEADTWTLHEFDISALAASARNAVRYARITYDGVLAADFELIIDAPVITGNRISTELNIETNDSAAISLIVWNATLNGGTVGLETNLSPDEGATYLGWKTATNVGAIPDITSSTDLSRARLKIRETLSSYEVNDVPTLNDVTITISRETTRFFIGAASKRVDGDATTLLTANIYTSDTYDEDAGTLASTNTLYSTTSWLENAITVDVVPKKFMRLEFVNACTATDAAGEACVDDVLLMNELTGQGFVYSMVDKTWTPTDIQLSGAIKNVDDRLIGSPLNRDVDGYHVLAYVFDGTDLLTADIDGKLTFTTNMHVLGNKILSDIDVVYKEIGDYDLTVTVTNEEDETVTDTINLEGNATRAKTSIPVGLFGEFFTVTIEDDSDNPAFEIQEIVLNYRPSARR